MDILLGQAKQQIKSSSGRVSIDLTLDILGVAVELLRRDQATVYTFISANFSKFNLHALESFYNLLLRRLTERVSVKALVGLLKRITGPRTVTQSRVNFLVALYRKNPRNEFAELLKVMRLNAPQAVYIPLVGQESAHFAKLPLSAQFSLLKDDLVSLSPVFTVMARTLYHTETVTGVAEILASLMPLVYASGEVPLAVQEFIFGYVQKWDGEPSPALRQILRACRHWPQSQGSFRIITELTSRASSAAALAILEELSLIDHRHMDGARLCDKALQHKGRYAPICVYQYYAYTALHRLNRPPESHLTAIILRLPSGLMLCDRWASPEMAISQALRGEPQKLVKSTDACKELELSSRLSLSKCPWLGNIQHVLGDNVNEAECIKKLAVGELGISNYFSPSR